MSYEVQVLDKVGSVIYTETAPQLGIARAWARPEHRLNPACTCIVKSNKTGRICMNMEPVRAHTTH